MSISVPTLKRVYCTAVKISDAENIVTLKYGLEVTQDNWK